MSGRVEAESAGGEAWRSFSMSWFGVTRTWRSGLRTCGAIFDRSAPREELSRLETEIARPDFWKDQAEAQKILQRRRRLEQEVGMVDALKRREDDLAVLVEWAAAGEDVSRELGEGLDALAREVDAAETKKIPTL